MDKYITLIEQNIFLGNPTIQGWCPTEKAKDLFSLVAENKPSVIVEVGVFGGMSLIPMAWGCEHNGEGRVYGIDPWCAPAAMEGKNDPANDEWWSNLKYEDVYAKFVQNILGFGLLSYVYWFRNYSREVAPFFAEGIDIFHCDGNHSEEVTMQELELYFPLLRPGGFWVADDISWPSLEKAVSFLRENCEVIKEVEQNGSSWGIYRKK